MIMISPLHVSARECRNTHIRWRWHTGAGACRGDTYQGLCFM